MSVSYLIQTVHYNIEFKESHDMFIISIQIMVIHYTEND